MDSRRITPLLVLAIGAALVVGACGSDDEGPIPQTGERQTTTTAETTTTTTTTTAPGGGSAAGDGDTLAAAGIDMLVRALR